MWMSKQDAQKRAHFVVDGASLCSHLTDCKGTRLAPFLTPFGTFDEWSHLCTTCQRLEAEQRGGPKRKCTCGKCRVGS